MKDKKTTCKFVNNEDQDEKLRIALFIDTFYPMIDGVVQVVDNYARILSRDCDVTVFTIKPRSGTYDDSILPYKVVRCKRIKVSFLDYDLPVPSLDKDFQNEIFRKKFDIIHIHSPFGIGKLGVKYAKKNNVPVVATMHSQFYKDFLKESHSKTIAKMLLKKVMKVFNSCDECLAVNSEVAKIYFNEYKAKTMPLTRNNGTDMKPIIDIGKISKLKQEYGITDDEKVLLFVGRLTVLKNILFIADCMKKLKDKNFKFKMLYVGSGPDEDKLKEKIEALGLADDVKLLGRIADRDRLACIYKMADLFVFPSLYDCSSLVQIESSCQSTPALFIQGSATSDGVIDGVNGYLADNSIDSYADKILQIFADMSQYNNVCTQCYEDLYLSWDKAVELAKQDYIRLIEDKKNK